MKKLVTAGLVTCMISTNVVTSFAFSDVSENHWAKKQIQEYTNRGILGGYEDGTFKPSQNITRAEFVKVMNKAFALSEFNYDAMLPSEASFNDINNHWAKSDIMIAVSNGIYDYVLNKDLNKNFNFRPNDYITREEASAMIANYLKINDSDINRLNYFTDNNKVVYWAKQGVEGLIENNILNGYEDKTIRPQGNLTRAEAVLMVQRAENVKNKKPAQQPSNNNINDSNTSIPKFDIVTTPVEDMIEYAKSCGYTEYKPAKDWYSHKDQKQEIQPGENYLSDYGRIMIEDGSYVKKYHIKFVNSVFDSKPECLESVKQLLKPFFNDDEINQIIEIHRNYDENGGYGVHDINGTKVSIHSRNISITLEK